jgi:hypothetical protein
MTEDLSRSPADAPPRAVEASPEAQFLEVVAVLVIVGIAVGLLEWFYAANPVPPGVDPGDWIQRSYGWVGLAHPPVQSVGSPFLYPPAIFPLLGVLRLATGSAQTTGFVFAGCLLAMYGLTLWYLARVLVTYPAHRVAIVALGVLNGTVLSMLFWGAYPNFLAFSFVNLTLALLLLHLRGPTLLRGALVGLAASLTYLTHTLTFDLLIGIVALSFLLAIALGRVPWKILIQRGTLVGAALLAVTVAAYTAVTDLLHIPHINYLYANPPAFTLTGLDTVFTPLAKSPMFTPMGGTVEFSTTVTAVLLGVAGVVAILLGIVLVRMRPRRWELATLVASCWLGVMLLAPVAGYVAHFDTDYSRFVYFFPLPLVVLAVLALEGSLPRSTIQPSPAPGSPSLPPPSSNRWLRPRPYSLLSGGLVVLGVAFLLVNVSIPTMSGAETNDAQSGHDAAFLAAIHYIATNPAPGSVLTTQSAARWTEALTARGAYDPGPTWLQYEPWEVTNAQETYFALNSQTGVTNNLLVASYSGYASSALGEAPMVSALVLGVPLPILRVLPGLDMTDTAGSGCPGWSSAAGAGVPALSVSGATFPSGQIIETNSCATTVQSATLAPNAPEMWLNYTVTPATGDSVLGFNFTIASPPPRNTALHAGPVTALAASGTSLTWSSESALGQFPGGTNVTLNGVAFPTPVASTANATNGSGQVSYAFSNPSPSAPLAISFLLSVPTASNPAIVLPTVLSTAQYLSMNDIEFLLLPSTVAYAETLDFLSTTFGFTSVYTNTEWTVLQAP